jgi:hypothetical protein
MSVRGSIASDVRAIQRDMPKWLAKEAKIASDISVEEVRRRTPIGRIIDPETGHDLGPSGKLWHSISPIKPHYIAPGVLETGAYSDNEVANMVEEGTRAHPIPMPGRHTVLRFWSEGRLYYRSRVNHPGTRGAHMFARGIVAAERRYAVGAERRLKVLFTR